MSEFSMPRSQLDRAKDKLVRRVQKERDRLMRQLATRISNAVGSAFQKLDLYYNTNYFKLKELDKSGSNENKWIFISRAPQRVGELLLEDGRIVVSGPNGGVPEFRMRSLFWRELEKKGGD